MSSTVIVGFDKTGTLLEEEVGAIHNSWRGAPVIWRYFEEKYLEPWFPDYISEEEKAKGIDVFEQRHGYRPSRLLRFSDNSLDEICELAYNPDIPEDERIVLITTFDKVLVRKEEIPCVIEAFRNFPEETSLPEQADILEMAYNDSDIVAVGWIQTTVCCDMWCGGYDEDNDEEIPYNFNVNKEHHWVFDLLNGRA